MNEKPREKLTLVSVNVNGETRSAFMLVPIETSGKVRIPMPVILDVFSIRSGHDRVAIGR